jgi:hypothetical protein
VNSDIDHLFSQWARLGALFEIQPSRTTPDVERLLIATAGAIPASARLHAMAVSWLGRHDRLVCRHRLAVLASQLHSRLSSAVLGHVLSAARRVGRTRHFNLPVKACQPLETPRPLFDAYRGNPALIELARSQTDEIGRTWGLWGPGDRHYDDAIRPAEWIMTNNPALMPRALFSGGLAASILVTLDETPRAGESELALARACGATRSSVRDALDHLELCRRISRERSGAGVRVRATQQAG